MQVKKNKNVEQALKNATNGIMLAAKGEKSIHREFGITVVVLILAAIFKISKIELILVIFAIALVIVTEMINTAIELCIDIYTDKFNMYAKKAKDIAAGAVVISIVFAGFIGTFVFYDKVMEVLDKILVGIGRKR
jgi:diacylglycerol kinase